MGCSLISDVELSLGIDFDKISIEGILFTFPSSSLSLIGLKFVGIGRLVIADSLAAGRALLCLYMDEVDWLNDWWNKGDSGDTMLGVKDADLGPPL